MGKRLSPATAAPLRPPSAPGDMKASSSGLSRAFSRDRVHAGAFSGGAAAVSVRGFLACMYFGRVKILESHDQSVRCEVQNEGEEDDEVGSLLCVCVKPNAEEVVTADQQLRLRRWSVPNKKATLEKTVNRATDAPVLAMAYDKTGTLVVTGASDRLVRVFDMEKGFCTHSYRGHDGVVHSVLFAPVARPLRAMSCSEDNSVKVWDLHENRCVATLKGHTSAVTGVAFALEESMLVTCGRDQVLSFWDLDTYTILFNLPVYEEMEGVLALPRHSSELLSSATATEGFSGMVVTAGANGRLRFWAYNRERSAGKSKGKKKVKVKMVKEQSDGPTPELGYKGMLLDVGKEQREGRGEGGIIAVTGDHNFLFFDMQLNFRKLAVGYNDDILDLKELPGGDGSSPHRVAVATNSADVRIFDTSDFSVLPVQGHTDTVLSVDVSKDGSFLATASKDKTLRFWDLRGDSPANKVPCLMECRGHADAIGAVCIAQKAATSAAGSASKWNSLWTSAFLASGASDKTLKVWAFPKIDKKGESESTTLSQTPSLSIKAHDKDINAIAIAPNDSMIATASQDKAVNVYDIRLDAATAKRPLRVALDLKFQLKGHKRGVWMVKFSPVDRAIATSSGDRTVKLWGLANGQCLKTFQGHTSSVLNLVFLRNGMQLASCGADGLIKLWTIRTNECEATIDAHGDKIWALTATNDGEHLISGGSDSTIAVWKDVTLEEEEKRILENEIVVEKEQELANSLYKKDFRRAAALSFELDKPVRLLKVLGDYLDQEWMRPSSSASEKENPFLQMVGQWNDKYAWKSLEYIKLWNANVKHMVLAQLLLDALLKTRVSPREWKEHKHSMDLCEAIVGYTQKHAERVDRLIEGSYLVDHIVRRSTELLDTREKANVDVRATQMNAAMDSMVYTIAEEDDQAEDFVHDTSPLTPGEMSLESAPTSKDVQRDMPQVEDVSKKMRRLRRNAADSEEAPPSDQSATRPEEEVLSIRPAKAASRNGEDLVCLPSLSKVKILPRQQKDEAKQNDRRVLREAQLARSRREDGDPLELRSPRSQMTTNPPPQQRRKIRDPYVSGVRALLPTVPRKRTPRLQKTNRRMERNRTRPREEGLSVHEDVPLWNRTVLL